MPVWGGQRFDPIVVRTAWQPRRLEKIGQGEFLPQLKHYFGYFCRANFFARTKALNFFRYATSARSC
ncbi:hypothetical protein PCE31107_02721 [Pandoraea cepalis]|uniref:Uncharacterized protein n=1 Tax=Pandoraea cepalis TaxID=2508294 RepID=A0A5E4VJT5_9BURK|nr:hypothetical protein PCE31107_02721 [Pandoraea cepalis]